MGCKRCDVEIFLEAGDEDATRQGLTGFFDEHEGHDVFLDVSRTTAPLPGRPGR